MRAVTFLESVRRFFEGKIEGATVAERAGPNCAANVRRVGGRLMTVRSDRPDRVAALVLGEFKAGKSTLINALVGRRVAATDVFELTQVVCRVVPVATEHEERVEIIRRHGPASAVTLTIDDFVRRAQARELSDYAQASVYVRSCVDLVLVDTPGLGATLKHELDALNALSTADIALCTVDAENLGSSRDAAALARMGEIGLPFLCVLTKADNFTDDEAEIACDYLADMVGVDRKVIFAVSAARVLRGERDPGFERLRAYLSTGVAPQGAPLRERALLAQARDIAADYRLCIGQVLDSIRNTLHQVDEHFDSLRMMAELVTNDLCDELTTMLNQRLELEIEQFIKKNASRTITEADFAEAMKRCFAKAMDRSFIEHLRRHLERRDQEEWFEGIRSQIGLLQENLKAMQNEANAAATADLRNMVYHAELKQKALGDAIQAAIEGAAVGLGLLALGATLLPAALITTPFAFRAYSTFRKADEITGASSLEEDVVMLGDVISRWREDVVALALREFRPKLLELNQIVAERAANGFALKLDEWPLSVGELHDLEHSAQDLYDALGRMDRVSSA